MLRIEVCSTPEFPTGLVFIMNYPYSYKSGPLIINGALKINSIEFILLVEGRLTGKKMADRVSTFIQQSGTKPWLVINGLDAEINGSELQEWMFRSEDADLLSSFNPEGKQYKGKITIDYFDFSSPSTREDHEFGHFFKEVTTQLRIEFDEYTRTNSSSGDPIVSKLRTEPPASDVLASSSQPPTTLPRPPIPQTIGSSRAEPTAHAPLLQKPSTTPSSSGDSAKSLASSPGFSSDQGSAKTTATIRLFYSYSHEDESLRDELAKHLSSPKRQGIIAEWHDRRIGAGDEWKGAIDENLEEAQIILLLVSSSFLASDYCWDVETKRALERHNIGDAKVIPIILRPCDWHGAPFGQLQALPKDAKAVTTWTNKDEAWTDVALGIRRAVESMTAKSR